MLWTPLFKETRVYGELSFLLLCVNPNIYYLMVYHEREPKKYIWKAQSGLAIKLFSEHKL